MADVEDRVEGGEENDQAAQDRYQKSLQEGKVIILLVNTGNAPILKQKRVKAEIHHPFAQIIDHVRRKLKAENVLLFVNQSFSPAPDEVVGDLFKAFHIKGQLVVHYALSEAWG